MTPDAQTPTATRVRRPLRSYWAVGVCAVVGLVLTLAAVETERRGDLAAAQGATQVVIAGRIKALQTHFERYEDLIGAVRAYIEGAGGSLEMREFGVVAAGLLRGRSGVRSLAYVPRVKGAARSAYETVARDAGFANFHFTERTADGSFVPAAERAEYFPVYDLEPLAGNEWVLGFDLASNPERRRALERARDTGRPTATARPRLLQGKSNEYTLLIIAPVYFPIQGVNTLEDRRANLAGYVIGTFRLAEAIDDVLNASPAAAGLDHYFFDGPDPKADNVMYVHASRVRLHGMGPLPYDEIRNGPHAVSSITVANRNWAVVTVPLAVAFLDPFGKVEWATLLAGLFATALGSLYLFGTIRRSRYFEALANDLRITTEELKREAEERKRVEEAMSNMARHDVLTELPNRRVFVDAVQQAIARKRRGAKSFAVLYLDLDHFKDINDTLGHPMGDRLLKAAGRRLTANVRETDLVARFGGDEFAVLQADISDPGDAGVLAAKLLAAIGELFVIDGNEIRCGTSIGVALYSSDVRDAETLLSHADVALYRAKTEGRHRYRFFTEAMDLEVRKRFQLGNELRVALATEQLYLVYQPEVETRTGRILGVEALVRWRHPQRGLLPPGEFIPVAERTGLIVALGHWVLREACRQAKAWLDAGIAPGVIAVNLSALQLRSPLELEQDIAAILGETGLPPGMLELELTESTLMETSREHNDTLLRLRQSGVKLAIDDFGTGYSSLDYLRRFPVDRIKVAQDFVFDLTTDPGNAAIVKAAIGLARELGLNVIAEGVETAEQKAFLEALGCGAAQGYYFAKPMSAGDAAILLRSGRVISPPPAVKLERRA